MPPVAVGVAAGLGSALFATSVLTGAFIGVGAALGTKILTDALTPDLGDYGTDPVADQALTTNANQPRKIIYGESVVGGQIVGVAAPTISKKEHDILVVHLAGHPCDSVTIYEIEGKTVAELGDAVTMTVYLGNQTTADSTANTYINGWTNDHIGYEQTYVVLKIRRDEELFPRGVNECKFIVRGRKVYDPRKDTTAGGSGAHRPEDSTTWEWSDNPALCAYDYLRHYGSRPVPLRRIPWDFVALTANYCAEQASYTDADGNAATGQRFGCNGALNNGIRPGEGLNNIMATMGAKPYRVGGKIFIKPAMYAGPATVTVDISETNARPLHRPHRPLREITNTVRAEYVAPTKKWQVTAAPTVFSQAYIDKDGSMLATTIRLNMVTKDHQAQRLAKLKLERSRAGFITSYPLPGLRLDIVTGANIRFVSAGSGLNKEFTVEEAKYDASKNVTNLSLIEDAAAIYPDNFEPAEGDLTPNTTLPDATAIVPPNAVNYTVTPADNYRQGVLTWDHSAPESVVNYIVLITNQNGTPAFTQSYTPVSLSQDIANLPVGSYYAAVAAKNRFKTSIATQVPFNVGHPSTPTASPATEILPGRVIITGPELPNSASTYEWKYAFEDAFNEALNGGKNEVLTITNTPHDATVYVWYRIVDNGIPSPTWLQITIPYLIGIQINNIEPDFVSAFFDVEIPRLGKQLGATLEQLQNDIADQNLVNATIQSFVNGFYATLLQQTADTALQKYEVMRLDRRIGGKDVSLQFEEFTNLQFGYEDDDGNFVDGALGEHLERIKYEDSAGQRLSVYEYFQVIEDDVGELFGRIDWAIDNDGIITGVFITGSDTESSIKWAAERQYFMHPDGRVVLGIDTDTGEFQLNGIVKLADGTVIGSKDDLTAATTFLTWSGDQTLPTNADISTAFEIVFSSDRNAACILNLTLFDADGSGTTIALNDNEIDTVSQGAAGDNIETTYQFNVDVISGTNSLKLWAPSTDGVKLRKVTVTPGRLGYDGAGQYRLVLRNGVFPDDTTATADFVAAYGRQPVKDTLLIYVNADGSVSSAKLFDGAAWGSVSAYFPGDLIALGSIYGDRFVAGSEINAPVINGGLLKASALRYNSARIYNEFNRLGPVSVRGRAFDRGNTPTNRTLTLNAIAGPQAGVEWSYNHYRALFYKTDIEIDIHAATPSNFQRVNTTTVEVKYLLEISYQSSNPTEYAAIHDVWETIQTSTIDPNHDYGSVILFYQYTTRDEPWTELVIRVSNTSTDADGRPMGLAAKIELQNNVESPHTPHTITTDNNTAPVSSPPPIDDYEPPPGAYLP